MQLDAGEAQGRGTMVGLASPSIHTECGAPRQAGGALPHAWREHAGAVRPAVRAAGGGGARQQHNGAGVQVRWPCRPSCLNTAAAAWAPPTVLLGVAAAAAACSLPASVAVPFTAVCNTDSATQTIQPLLQHSVPRHRSI